MKKSNKLNARLKEHRDQLILYAFDVMKCTAEEIGEIFDLTTSAVYNTIKDYKTNK